MTVFDEMDYGAAIDHAARALFVLDMKPGLRDFFNGCIEHAIALRGGITADRR